MRIKDNKERNCQTKESEKPQDLKYVNFITLKGPNYKKSNISLLDQLSCHLIRILWHYYVLGLRERRYYALNADAAAAFSKAYLLTPPNSGRN